MEYPLARYVNNGLVCYDFGERFDVVFQRVETREFSFQEFEQLILAVADDFSAGVPCIACIGFKPPKNSARLVAEHFVAT